MTTARQLAANRINSTRSTGPRTAAGKRRASANALRHGLRCAAPVLPGEDAAEWELFRLGVLDDVRPVGTLETELANRLASLQWRLRRVTTFEVAVAVAPPAPAGPPRVGWVDTSYLKAHRDELESRERALGRARRLPPLLRALATGDEGDRVPPDDAVFLLDQAAFEVWMALSGRAFTLDANGPLPAGGDPPVVDAQDPTFLAPLGVPAEYHAAPERWDGWTVGRVRAGVAVLAKVADWPAERLTREMARADFPWLEKRVLEMRVEVERSTAVTMGGTAIPPDAALEAVLRYEPHLTKQVTAVLDQLERARALRR